MKANTKFIAAIVATAVCVTAVTQSAGAALHQKDQDNPAPEIKTSAAILPDVQKAVWVQAFKSNTDKPAGVGLITFLMPLRDLTSAQGRATKCR